MTDRLDTIEQTLTEIRDAIGQPPLRWMTVAKAAVYADLCELSVRRLISAGKITAHRPTPGKILIDRIELDAYIQGATHQARSGRGMAAGKAAKMRAGRAG